MILGIDIWVWDFVCIVVVICVGEIFSCEVMEVVIVWMYFVNLVVNVVVDDMVDEVLVVVDFVDVVCKCGNVFGFLYGVLIMVKINVDIVGYVMMVGFLVVKDVIVVEDSVLVVNFCYVGVVIVGCINVFVFCYCWFMNNDFYGKMLNFWDFLFIFGGLSGGVVVVLVIGIGLIVYGNDVVGLLCLFVSVNGIYGFKLIVGCVLGYNFLV